MLLIENKFKQIAVHLLLWICFSMFSIGVASIEIGEVPNEMIIRLIFNPILFYVNCYVLIPKFLLTKKILLYLIWSIIFLTLFNYIIINFFESTIFNSLKHPIDQVDNLPQIYNIKYLAPSIFSLSFFLLGGIFGLLMDVYKRKEFEKIRIKKHKEMELQFLRTQLKPHFLFNTLNSIYSLVRSKSDDAPEAIITLSELMRYMLYEVGKNKVPLEKEINYIKNYMSLQKLRLINSDNVKLHVEGNYNHLKIYPLLLISFIENAFKHGVDNKGETNIEIDIRVNNSTLYFNTKNIMGVDRKEIDNSGIGMDNIKSQLKFLYKDKYKLLSGIKEGVYMVFLTIDLS
ncbi:sensor histidine kinase [Xanthomarina gelatinilytica]|jgi:sensor histidine kinase YesM|uniref:sensor histidine kinase n=1 Tax=Xanthomarina gelatinilytica TaxID=1137281 RepID=UPI003AA86027